MKFVGYTRVSRVGDRELGLPEDASEEQKEEKRKILRSPDQQRKAIEAWAQAQEEPHEIVWLEPDLDWSGKSLDRPSMSKALELIRAGEVDGLVVARLDRLTRSVKDLDYLMSSAESDEWTLVAIDLNLDNSTANGKLIWGMMGLINKWYLDRSRETWTQARRDATKRGQHMGPKAPIGYRRREDGKLELDPVSAPTVRELFERRAAGENWSQIARALRAKGSTSPTGDVWSRQAASRIVQNEVYLGVLSDAMSGERHVGAHPPIVDRGTWLAAQRPSGPRWVNGGSRPLLLKGLLRCSGCRFRMTSHTENKKQAYICRRHADHHDCPTNARIFATEGDRIIGLDEYIVGRMWAKLEEDGYDDLEGTGYGADSRVDELDAVAKAARDDFLSYLEDSNLRKVAGEDAFNAVVDTKRRAYEEAERARDEEMSRQRAVLGQRTRPLRRETWEQLTIDEQRDALSSVIQAIFVRRGGNVYKVRMAAVEGLEKHPDWSDRRIAEKFGVSRPIVGAVRHDMENGVAQRTLDDVVHIIWAGEEPVPVPKPGGRDWVHPTPYVFPDGLDDPREAGVARR